MHDCICLLEIIPAEQLLSNEERERESERQCEREREREREGERWGCGFVSDKASMCFQMNDWAAVIHVCEKCFKLPVQWAFKRQEYSGCRSYLCPKGYHMFFLDESHILTQCCDWWLGTGEGDMWHADLIGKVCVCVCGCVCWFMLLEWGQ